MKLPLGCETEVLRGLRNRSIAISGPLPMLPSATWKQFRFRYAPSKLHQTRASLELLDQDINLLTHAQYIPRSIVRLAPRAVLEALKFGGFARHEHLAKLAPTEYVSFQRGANGRLFNDELVVDYRELAASGANLVANIGQGQGEARRSPTTL
jgi:hypothetical protein